MPVNVIFYRDLGTGFSPNPLRGGAREEWCDAAVEVKKASLSLG